MNLIQRIIHELTLLQALAQVRLHIQQARLVPREFDVAVVALLVERVRSDVLPHVRPFEDVYAGGAGRFRDVDFVGVAAESQNNTNVIVDLTLVEAVDEVDFLVIHFEEEKVARVGLLYHLLLRYGRRLPRFFRFLLFLLDLV